MKCPKDAMTVYYEESPYYACEEDTGGFGCTRKDQHKGKHHSHDEQNRCEKVWA